MSQEPAADPALWQPIEVDGPASNRFVYSTASGDAGCGEYVAFRNITPETLDQLKRRGSFGGGQPAIVVWRVRPEHHHHGLIGYCRLGWMPAGSVLGDGQRP